MNSRSDSPKTDDGELSLGNFTIKTETVIKFVSYALPLVVAVLAILVMFVPGFGEVKARENGGVREPATEEAAVDDSSLSAGGFGLVPESPKADKSYFDDAAFVGDSISLMLNYYQASTGALGKAQMFTSGSLGAINSQFEIDEKSVHPKFNGVKMKVEDCVMKSGAKKVYIMFGINDIAYGLDKALESYEQLIFKIVEKSPNIIVFVESMTPIASTSSNLSDVFNNQNIQKYNKMLLDMCVKNKWYFVDVGSVMYDESGWLKKEYCSDLDNMGMHFTNEGCEQWVNYLLTHTVN